MNNSSASVIAELRKQGFIVSIRHKRGQSLRFTRNVELKNGVGKHFTNVVSPKGGETTVAITKDGVTYSGKARCRPNEAFCKKTGVLYALERALAVKAKHAN